MHLFPHGAVRLWMVAGAAAVAAAAVYRGQPKAFKQAEQGRKKGDK